MIIDLREKRERIDGEKASRQARKDEKAATQTAAQAASIPLKKKNSTQLQKKDRVSVTLSVLPSIEESGVAGSELEDWREMDEWEDNASDGSEYKGSLGRVCEDLERIQVSGGMGEEVPEAGCPGFHVDNSLRRSGRLTESRK